MTQSSRGEVGAVNIATGRILDSRVDIPGFTFVPVGELPSAIVVPASDPSYTYVANFGSRDVHVVRTSALLALEVDADPVVQRVPLEVDGAVGAPIDMVLAPEEDALLVAVAELGAVLRLPLARCDAGAPEDCQPGRILGVESIPLSASRDLLRTTLPAPAPHEPYEMLCGFPRPEPPVSAPIVVDDADMMTPPRPVALAVDAFCEKGSDGCVRRLLVADDALPVIHALDLDALAGGGTSGVLEPIYSGAPTTDVVITPRVPSSLEPDAPDTQFVYAVDARDGSVLVAENGRVIDVNTDPKGPPDRLFLGSAARGEPTAVVLEVITPAFDVMEGGGQYVRPAPVNVEGDVVLGDPDDAVCVDSENEVENPRRLRGVFLAAALTDGTVRIVDVHDREMNGCRTCPPAGAPQVPQLLRHHPRLASNFQVDPGIDPPDVAPVALSLGFWVDRALYPVRANGTTSTPAAPGLSCLVCDADLDTAFPSDDDEIEAEGDDAGVPIDVRCPDATPALVCGRSDPWSSLEETWRATYEGPLPGTRGGRGRLLLPGDPENISGEAELRGEVSFCQAGVLGLLDMPVVEGGAVEARGDQLVITSDVVDASLLEAADRDDCADLAAALDQEERPLLGFEILRAYADRLVVRPRSDERFPDLGRVDLSLLSRCTGRMLVSYQVHALDSYLVVGTQSGFLHRVVTDAAGRCVPDPSGDPLARGRAYAGVPFRNPTIAFQIRAAEEGEALEEPEPGVQLAFQLRSPAAKLVFDAQSAGFSSVPVVPVQLIYNDVDGILYLVDIHVRGLVPILLDPFRPTSSIQYD